jgi:hypothetical protein
MRATVWTDGRIAAWATAAGAWLKAPVPAEVEIGLGGAIWACLVFVIVCFGGPPA